MLEVVRSKMTQNPINDQHTLSQCGKKLLEPVAGGRSRSAQLQFFA